VPSLTVENYVKTIYQIVSAQDGGAATTGQLAAALDVSPGTVTSMLKTLDAARLATHRPYEGVALTRAGRVLALRMIRRHRLIELSAQPDKGLLVVLEFFVQLSGTHAQQARQLAQLGGVSLDVFRISPNAGRRHARCQQHAISVEHASPVGGQSQRPGKTNFALPQEKVIGENLHIGGTSDQARETQRNGRHNQFAAPNRGFAGQQRAR
jgi:DNA-binding MarR family transcriptional regulator